jgi:D-aspartate ligase
VPGRDDLAALWPRLTKVRTEFLVQQLVRGPESRIESFHVYVDTSGASVGEFTGRKIRTFPRDYGHSSAVEIVALPDVAEVGRDVVARLGARGVAKLDFKRDDNGRLHLLEINPRARAAPHVVEGQTLDGRPLRRPVASEVLIS